MQTIFILIIIVLIYCALLYKQHRRREKEEPCVCWSWLPYIGSAISFGTNALNFIYQAREKYGDVFVVIILGKRLIFVCDQKLGRYATTRHNKLKFSPVGNDVMKKVFGMYEYYTSELDTKLHKIYNEYLLRDNGIESLRERADLAITHTIKRRKKSFPNKFIEEDLYTFVRGIVFEATVQVIFGPSFLEKDETLLSIFDQFDAAFPILVGGVPIPSGVSAYKKLSALFFHDDYDATASAFICARAQLFKENTSRSVEAASQTAMLWAVVANTMPASFWTLYYILKSFESKSYNVDDNAWLDAAVTEALRLASGSLILRETTESTKLGTFSLRANDRVAVFPTVHHLDPTRFPDPLSFDPTRWLSSTNSSTSKINNIDEVCSFGAGASMCPGRKFAQLEIKLLILKLLHHFKFQFLEVDAPTPDFVAQRAGLGIYPPASKVPVRITTLEPPS